MALIPCTIVEGGAAIATDPARVHRWRNVTLAPIGHAHKPGLFDADGALVRPAAYFRGLPRAHFPLEAERLTWPRAAVATAPRGPLYVFAGHLTGHYGHFLFSVLGRLWSLPSPPPPHLRLVLLNGANAHEIFELEFARAIFQALGLTLEHFAVFRDPVRFEEIAVPDPSVEENHLGRPEFAALCHRIGRVLAPDTPTPRRRPVFLSKRLVKQGVHRIVNEEALAQALARRGYEIVSPERLPLREQVALWAASPALCGVSGSMLHTSIFSPGRRYVALSPEAWINSNQTILDRLNKNTGRVLFPREGYAREEAPGFHHGLRMLDPEGAARDLDRAVAGMREGSGARPSAIGSRILRLLRADGE